MKDTNSQEKNLLRKYPELSFLILAMVLGTSLVTLAVAEILPPQAFLLSALSASISGIVMTAIVDGKAGLKLMLKRLLIWRVGIGYWLFALFFIALIVLPGIFLGAWINGDPITLQRIEPAFNIVLLFIVFIIAAGLGQELGWTGFLVARLQSRYSALQASIIRAIFVVLWHLPLFFYSLEELPVGSSMPYPEWIAQKGFALALLAIFFLFILPWSVILTWIFNNTRGSLLLVAILHGSEIWVAYWMASTGLDHNNLDNYWVYGGLFVIAALILILTSGHENLSRKHQRVTNQLEP